MKIAILLTTYNSIKYIDEQLKSLQSQTYSDWDLYVRDDGSNDGTPDILQRYSVSDSRIHIIEDTMRRGAMQGFMWLLEQVKADYYMFCDHDDVWLPFKIEHTLSAMCDAEKKYCADAELPLIVHTDLRPVDSSLSVIHESYWKFSHFSGKDSSDKYFHLAYNNVTGCTMMINNAARMLSLPCPPEARMHDAWIAFCVLWNGGRIIELPEVTMLYRQHGGNTIGANRVPSLIDQFRRVKALIEKTEKQYISVCKYANISKAMFFVVKLYYMFLIHIRAALK